MPRFTLTALALGAGVAALSALSPTSAAAQAPAAAYEAPNYGDKANWLCWPGRDDACAGDNTAAVVHADGTVTTETWAADLNAPVDCFYVYPTVSTDPGVTSDLTPDPAERRVVEQQLSRFASKCRVFAPMYRQFTLTALRQAVATGVAPGGADRPNTGYQDVLGAWNWYLENENDGRGVVLIGHSQGSGVLTQLIAQEIDGKPVQDKLVSALLIGTNLPVEAGKDTGTFKSIPLCRAKDQTGCAISYVTFRDTVPPPAHSRFGRPRDPNSQMVVACTNPANLSGGEGELEAYLTNAESIAASSAPPPTWVGGKPNPETPFVKVPGLLKGECVSRDGFNYLQVRVDADPNDPRTDDIAGDVVNNGQMMADWGLHLIDVNVAMGNLVDIVGEQSKAYLAKSGS